jgi:hypothetical protein
VRRWIEVGSGKWGVGIRKLEVGIRKSEVGGRNAAEGIEKMIEIPEIALL